MNIRVNGAICIASIIDPGKDTVLPFDWVAHKRRVIIEEMLDALKRHPSKRPPHWQRDPAIDAAFSAQDSLIRRPYFGWRSYFGGSITYPVVT